MHWYGNPTTGPELLQRYQAGERYFHELNLEDIVLPNTDLGGGIILRGLRLHRAKLSGSNLSGASLQSTEFVDADLERVTFGGADLQQSILRGANLRGAYLAGADLRSADLSGADFRGAHLQRAFLSMANLTGANFARADLENANLEAVAAQQVDFAEANLLGVNFRNANLSRATLAGTQLQHAVFESAWLAEANLRGALLNGVTLTDARLDDVQLDGAHMSTAYLVDMDLSALCRARMIYGGPSHVDFRSIVRSLHEPRLKGFLQDIGLPDVFVEYMVDSAQTLSQDVVFSLLQTTFISYGGPDTAFAAKLNDALQAQGVKTFFFPDDAPPGAKLHAVMWHGVNEHDRVILVCSRASLDRPGVLNEIEKTLAREAREGGKSYLIPVIIDDYLLKEWAPSDDNVKAMAQELRDRVAADFQEHEDASAFSNQVSRLVAVLKKKPA